MSYERFYSVSDVEFRVVFNASPVIPAYISGPPEDCHPAEGGEVEILEIFIGDVEVSDVIASTVQDTLQEKISEDLGEICAPDFEEPERDDD